MRKNSLIVCYSYSGNTRRIAETIRRLTDGTYSRIYPRQPYPADFERLLEQVRKENQSGIFPSLLPLTERADGYDIIFAGTPNWCGTIAPPLAAWLRENDLTGKILLPFFSHCGGEDKGMEQVVRELCPDAKVGSSLYVLENRRENLEETVRIWLEQNGCEFREGRKEA